VIMRHRMALTGALAMSLVAGTAVLGFRAAADGASDQASVGRIGLADFKKDFEAGKLVLIDVRSADAYAAGHLPGALSFPLGALEQRAADLNALKKPIVTYCA
jgi:predicted sulfurtransferase